MSAGKYDILCNQGTDLELDIEIKNPNGYAQKLHGLTAHLGAKAYLSDSKPILFLWGSDTGEIVIDRQLGILHLGVTAADIALIPTSGVYDLFLQEGTGNAVAVLSGNFNLNS